MSRAVGAVLGGVLGLGFGTMGLIKTRGGFEVSGATDNSYVVAAGIAGVGALVGAFLFVKRPWALAGAIVGLAAGIWLRDNADDFGTVQPPMVFLLLFGLPLIGGILGWLIRARRTD